MEEQAESLRMAFDKFMVETTTALSQDTKQRDRFEYIIKNKEDDLLLSWKKRLDGNDIRVGNMLIQYSHDLCMLRLHRHRFEFNTVFTPCI